MGSFKRKFKAGSRPLKGPGDIQSSVSHLKALLLSAKDQRDIVHHFDTALVPNPSFMAMGEARSNEVLLSMIEVALKVSLGERKPLQGQLLFVSDFRFWHGYLLFEGSLMARVLFFDDVNRGVCTLKESGAASTRFFRFSIPEGTTEPFDPSQAELAGMSRPGPGGRAN